VADIRPDSPEPVHDQGGPVPKFLLLTYLVIGGIFVYYLATGLRFGSQSPTGF